MGERVQQGFTLIEVMVATAIMAVMGAASWLGIDSMLQSRARAYASAAASAELQIALSQWATDLDHAYLATGLEPMGWDGKVFRLTRRSNVASQGVYVVAWSVRSDGVQHRLMRWRSPAFSTMDQWQQAWQEASVWARGGSLGQPAVLFSAQEMQVHAWAGNAWVNAQSDAGYTVGQENAAQQRARLTRRVVQPQGIRLMVHTESGVLTKDWVNPTFSENKS